MLWSKLIREQNQFNSTDEITQFVSEFEACTWARERWTHEAHLTVGLWYLVRHEEREATARIRAGIKRYNQACGIAQTETSGYHETITLFYVRVISRYLARAPQDATLAELVRGLLATCGDRQLPFVYYSRERLFSSSARTSWVEPDLCALD